MEKQYEIESEMNIADTNEQINDPEPKYFTPEGDNNGTNDNAHPDENQEEQETKADTGNQAQYQDKN